MYNVIIDNAKGTEIMDTTTEDTVQQENIVAAHAAEMLALLVDSQFGLTKKWLSRRDELVKKLSGHHKMFRVSWKNYPNNPKPEVHPIEHFCEANGYDEDEMEALKKMWVGEEHVIGGPFDSVTIERLS